MDNILKQFVRNKGMDDKQAINFFSDFYSSSKKEQNHFISKVKYGLSKMQQGGEQDQVMQIVQAYAQLVGIEPNEIAQQLQQMQPQEQQQAIQEMVQSLQQEPQVQSNPQEEIQEQAQYGIVKKSKNGLYDYPMQPVVVPTENSGKITMKKFLIRLMLIIIKQVNIYKQCNLIKIINLMVLMKY